MVLIIIFFTIVLPSLIAVIYMISFIVRMISSEGYRESILLHPTASIITWLIIMLFFFIAIPMVKDMWEWKIENDAKNLAISQMKNPVITRDMKLSGLDIPKATQIMGISYKAKTFYEAHFKVPYTFQALQVDSLRNVDEKSATIKLSEPSEILGFMCKEGAWFGLYYEDNKTNVSECLLVDNFEYDNILWLESTEFTSLRYDVELHGQASYELDDKRKEGYLSYYYNKDTGEKTWRNKDAKLLYSNKETLEQKALLQSKFDKQRKLFKARQLKSYTFTFSHTCRCPDTDVLKIIKVLKEKVVEAYVAETLEPIKDTTHLKTIEELFDLIQVHINDTDSSLEITYNEKGHYPSAVKINANCASVDGHYFFSVSMDSEGI